MIASLYSALRATAFLTRLPPAARAFAGGPHPLGRDVAAFPVVGLLAAALPAGLLLFLCRLGLDPLAATAFAVLTLVALTGALHEDGLGDTADGLFGHRDAEAALAIMKDSRIGTYGALALMGSLLLRITLVADLAVRQPTAGALAMLGAAAASRGAMAWLWSALPTADRGGLADRVGRPGPAAGRRAALLGAALAVLTGAAAGVLAAGEGTSLEAAAARGAGAALLGLALALLVLFRLAGILMRRLGGQTGDALGAAQQLTEIALLLGLALALP